MVRICCSVGVIPGVNFYFPIFWYSARNIAFLLLHHNFSAKVDGEFVCFPSIDRKINPIPSSLQLQIDKEWKIKQKRWKYNKEAPLQCVLYKQQQKKKLTRRIYREYAPWKGKKAFVCDLSCTLSRREIYGYCPRVSNEWHTFYRLPCIE